jgi:hypothetical protein
LGEDKKIFFEDNDAYLSEWYKSSQEFVDFCEDILLYGGLKLWKV